MKQDSSIRYMFLGNLLALSAALCWGLNEPANKLLIPAWISAPGVALARVFGATALIWLGSLFVRRERIERGDWKTIAWSSVLMLGFIYVFSLAFNTASPIDIAIILTFQPILVVAIHAIFKHVRINWLELTGMLVALGGALLVILAGGSVSSGRFVGDLCALVCAVSYAAYLVVIEGPSRKYRPLTLMKWVFLFTSVLSLPLLFTVHDVELVASPRLTPVLVLAFIVAFPTVYCYLVIPPSIKMVGSEIFSIYQYLVPVVATVVSLLLKIDAFHWYQPVGFVIIVAGVILANSAKRRAGTHAVSPGP